MLVTGPTGSGKDHHALRRALSEIQSDEDKIVTIEDPVEYQLHGITQIPINEKKGLTFARGGPALDPAPRPRQDHGRRDPRPGNGPDRDPVRPDRASRVHDGPCQQRRRRCWGRFLNMGVEAYNFVSALNCILAQRLVRVICTHCRVGRRYSAERLAASSPRSGGVVRVRFQ